MFLKKYIFKVLIGKTIIVAWIRIRIEVITMFFRIWIKFNPQIKLNFDSLVRLENRVEMYQSLSLMYKCLGKLYSFHMSTHCTLPQKKKDGDRSKGKGRRVCLGGRIYLIPCRASCCASVDLEEKVEFILSFQIDQVALLHSFFITDE